MVPLAAALPEGAPPVPEKIHATRTTAPVEFDIAILALLLNGEAHEDGAVRFQGEHTYVPRAELEAAGLNCVGLPTLEIAGVEHVDVNGAPAQLSARVDEEALALVLTTSAARLPRSTINLTGPGADVEFRKDTSAFLNYGVRVLNFSTVDSYGELGLTIADFRLYSGLSYAVGADPVRGLSNVTFDDRAGFRRVVGGDSFASAGTLGGGAYVGGIQLSHSRSFDPYFTPGPTLDRSAEVLVPSTIEVYVNGQLRHTEHVSPGPVDIRNIPAIAGAGDTRIVLRDALGHEQVLSASYYQPTGLLGKGDQEYNYALGFERLSVATESFSYGSPVLVGQHRYGLASQATLSGQAAVELDRAEAGLGATAGIGFGQLEISGAGSLSTVAPGGAAALAWAFRGRRAGLSLWGRTTSDTFTTVGLDASADRATFESGTSVGFPVTPIASVSISYALSGMRDTGLGQRATLSGGIQLPYRLHLGLLGGWTRNAADDVDEFMASASLSTTIGRRTTASVRGESDAGASGAYAEVQQSLPAGSGLGYRVGGRVGDVNGAFASGDGRSSFGQARLGVDWTPEATGTELGVSGGLVALGGRVFATPPVTAGYALVRVPDVKGVSAYLDNNLVGHTDRHGDVIVPGLVPSYGNRFGIEDLDVPPGYAIEGVERVVATSERSGVVVEFPVKRARLLRGNVRGVNADFGELVIERDGLVWRSPIGHDGYFELDSVPQGTWTGNVRHPGGTCVLELAVPVGDEPVVSLGDVSCIPTERMSVR